MKSNFFANVVWALDIVDEPALDTHATFLLGALSRATDVRIHPVYVLGNPYARIINSSDKIFEDAFTALAEKRMAEVSKELAIARLAPGKVLNSGSPSVRQNVQSLLEYAQSINADAIVVSTHARKGLPRLFLGSFAETLVLNSPLPVFTVNPNTQVRERLSTILVATTFQPRYRKPFERAVELARLLDASLTLFHKEPPLPSFAKNTELHRIILQEAKDRKGLAEEWRAFAQSHGVATTVHLDENPGPIVDAICSFAQDHNFDLVAMATEADGVSANIIGSYSRQTIRQAPCPVWVSHIES